MKITKIYLRKRLIINFYSNSFIFMNKPHNLLSLFTKYYVFLSNSCKYLTFNKKGSILLK